MKTAVIGSRTFNNQKKLFEVLSKHNISLVISGGAKGADKLAESYADVSNIEKLIFLPDWGKHRKAAGFIRNKDIIENAELVIAFWDGVSKGTKHSIDLAVSLGKKVIIEQF